MSDDTDRILARLEESRQSLFGRATTGAPAFVGRVSSTNEHIAVEKFLLVNPVEVAGVETEGEPGSFIVDASRTIPVYLAAGLPVQGDDLVCRFVDHRWVARKRSHGYSPPIGVTIPGCNCHNTPLSLSLTVNDPTGKMADATLQWYPDPPSHIPIVGGFGPGYYSTTTFIDPDFPGHHYYYFLSCLSIQWELGVGSTIGQPDGQFGTPGRAFDWIISSSPAVNFCSPFGLYVGTPSGGFPAHPVIVG